MAKCTYGRRGVSINVSDVYLLWNAPVEALGQMFAFGEAVSGDEAIVPSVEGEKAGDGNGDRNGSDGDDGGNGDVDSTMSSGGIHSTQVNVALLAEESQPMRQTQRTRSNDLLMSSGSPIRHANHPYGLVRPHRQCGWVKLRSINVSQMQEVKKTHLESAYIVQPP